jgi:hypothetical protein
VDFNESDFDVKEKREEVNKLLKLSVLEACDYCNGGNIHSKLIPAAVQQPRSMNKYFD